jgi:DHA2 family multidrug resistance protein-like MFS transporter
MGWAAALSILVGLAIGSAFLRRQRRLADPLIDLKLFRVPAFSAALAVNVLGFSTTFAAFLFIAQYLQSVIGLTPLQAGLWGLPSALSFVAGSMLTPMIVRRFRPASVIVGGMAVSAAGFVLLALVDNAASPLAMLVAGSVVFSAGLTPVVTLTTDLVLGAAPPERAGAAASMSETSSEFGGALGIAVLGSIVTAVYRSEIAGTLPAGIPSEAAEAARATLGGAVAAAENLPGPAGAALLDVARAAFAQSFEIVSGVSAVIAVAIAILAAAMLRRVPMGSGPAGAVGH